MHWLRLIIDTRTFKLPREAGWTPLMEILARCSCVAIFICCLSVTILLLIFCSHDGTWEKRPIFRSRRVAMAFAGFTGFVSMHFLTTAVMFIVPVMRLWVLVTCVTALASVGTLLAAIPAFLAIDWLRRMSEHDDTLARLEDLQRLQMEQQDFQLWQQEGLARIVAALTAMPIPHLEKPPHPSEVPLIGAHGGDETSTQ
jgi:hypothetical protein